MIIGMRGHDFGRMAPEQLAIEIRSTGFLATQLAFGKAFPPREDGYLTSEALASIPMLTLADLSGEPAPLPCTKTSQDGTAVLLHDTGSDLKYLDLFFEASDLQPEDMPLINLLGDLLGTLETEHYTGAELQTAVRQSMGQLSFGAEVFHQDAARHRMVFSARCVCLGEHQDKAADLLFEILNTTRFTDTDAVKKLLRQKQTANQQRLVAMGNRYAAARVAARETSAGAARELLSGCEAIRWVGRQCREENLSPLMARMADLCRKLFCRSRLTVSLSANARNLLPRFLSAFPQGQSAP